MDRDELIDWANSSSRRMPQGAFALDDLYRVKQAIKALVRELQNNGTLGPSEDLDEFPRNRG